VNGDESCLEPFTIFAFRFTIAEMDASTRKTISLVFRWLSLIWFVALLVFESRYLISVFRQQRAFGATLGIIYEEQIEGINFIIMVVYLIPGLFAWAMHKRFKKEY
jgi:hypothetical protein